MEVIQDGLWEPVQRFFFLLLASRRRNPSADTIDMASYQPNPDPQILTGPTYFLEIPEALRCKIYRYFFDQKPEYWNHRRHHPVVIGLPCVATPCPWKRKLLFKDGTSPIPLLQTCKKINGEAQAIMWDHVSLYFWDTTPKLRIMLFNMEDMVSRATSLDIVQHDRIDMTLDKIMEMVRKFKNLQSLRIAIRCASIYHDDDNSLITVNEAFAGLEELPLSNFQFQLESAPLNAQREVFYDNYLRQCQNKMLQILPRTEEWDNATVFANKFVIEEE